MDAGFTHYTVGRGLPELRRKITEKLKEENGCSYSPDEIMVTPGGKYAVYLAVRGLVNPGDEVIISRHHTGILKRLLNTGIQDIELGNCKGMGAYDQLHATEAPR